MIQRLLIANRGEIACRIIRSARDMGLHTIALHSEIDRSAPHVYDADEAVLVDSYLDIDAVISAAKATGADAIHPGYGFLSERSAFAQAVEDAGITLVGPSARVMEQMGRKDAARKIAEEAGVAVVPSYDVEADAAGFEFPVLVKAAAGGGGKGMRIVRHADEYADAVAAARREAQSRLRRRHHAGREVRRVRSPHRGAGARRPARQRGPPLRARLLHPASSPEGARGGPRPDHHARAARRGDLGRGRPRAAGGLRERRHRGVPARQRNRQHLLPGDEHAPPGRTPGDRDGDGRRPRRAPAPGRLGRGAAVLPGRPAPRRPRDRGAGLRRGLLRWVPAAGRHGDTGALARTRPGRRGVWRAGRSSRRRTTRCSAR